jgi:D-aminoacyl-tRNA deacylase
MPTIVITKKDPASVTMGNVLLEEFDFEETSARFQNRPIYKYKNFDLITLDRALHIHADYLMQEYPSDLYIFLSKHESKSKKPCLTAHAPGNFWDAQLGGKPFEVCIAPAINMANYLKTLKENIRSSEYNLDICYEVTHHGPTFMAPAMFVEIGSSEEYWLDEDLARIVVKSLINSFDRNEEYKVAIGVGDGHYAPKFTDLLFEKNFAFGHIIPNYLLEYISKDMLNLAFEYTMPRPEYIISRVELDIVKEFALEHNLRLINL